MTIKLRTIIFTLLISSIGFLSAGGQSHAQEMSESERLAIEEVVRNYILEHPEILPEAIAILQARQAAIQQEQMTTAVIANHEQLINDGYSVVGGNPDGDVTIVEFYDYRCPYCVQTHADVERLLASDPNLRIVYKQFPIKDEPGQPPVSLTAARMAQAIAKQGITMFNEFHDKLMSFNASMTIEQLGQAAASLGADMVKLQADMQDPAMLDGFRSSFAVANEIGINGTPTFVIGDQVLVGVAGYDAMKAAVDKARAN